MTYLQVFISSMLDIPNQIGAFAQSIGWTVDTSTPNQPILTHPTIPSALPIMVRATIGGTNNQDQDLIFEVQNVLATSSAVTRSPKLSGATNNPTVPVPTSLHLFGDLALPFIGVVIEYGFNRYRHAYLGYLDKAFDYTGGEIISGTNGPDANAAVDLSYLDPTIKYLFSGRASNFADSFSGGARVSHPSAPVQWYENVIPNSSTVFTQFTNNRIMGGYRDGFNDPYVSRGQSSFAGAVVLTPINQYVSQPITGDVRFVPVGAPFGVRMVNMRNIEPAQTVNIAGDLWKCFPAISKRTETLMPRGGGNYRTFETSFEVGYAYKEN